MISHRSPISSSLKDLPLRYEQTASPFQWTFSCYDLSALLAKLPPQATAAAARDGKVVKGRPS
jgi:hypothetical protein